MVQDRPRIFYNSPHVPAEWIDAHGFQPSRVTPATGFGGIYTGMGVCSYAAALIHETARGSDGAAIVLAASCDQMRRLAERLAAETPRPVFLLGVPTAVEAPTARPLYREELQRLGRFLERLGGKPPEPSGLAEVMARYDGARNRLGSLRRKMSARSFSGGADALSKRRLDRIGPIAVRTCRGRRHTPRIGGEPIA